MINEIIFTIVYLVGMAMWVYSLMGLVLGLALAAGCK